MSTDAEKIKKFSAFLMQKRVELSFKEGRPINQSEMARRIGIPQGSLSQYEKGTRLPNEANYHKIAAEFGPQVYDILEVPRSLPADEDFQSLALIWFDLPEDFRKKLLHMAEEGYKKLKEIEENIMRP